MSTSRWAFLPGVAAAGTVAAGVVVGAAAYFGVEGVKATATPGNG